MFKPEKLADPMVVVTKFGNLSVTHSLKTVTIIPTDRVPVIIKTVYGIMNPSTGMFEVCNMAKPVFETLDAPGFAAFLDKTGGTFAIADLTPACAARAVELKAQRDQMMERLRLQAKANQEKMISEKAAAALAKSAAAAPVSSPVSPTA